MRSVLCRVERELERALEPAAELEDVLGRLGGRGEQGELGLDGLAAEAEAVEHLAFWFGLVWLVWFGLFWFGLGG